MDFTKVFQAAAVVAMVSLAACFGGGSSSSADDSAQIAALQKTVDSLTSALSTVQKNQAADEQAFANVQQFGHIPGAAVSAAEQRFGIRTSAVRTAAVDTTDYGQCTNNGGMGNWSGHGPLDSDGSITDYFKLCTGNTMVTNSTTGKIADAPIVWYTGTGCSGTVIEFVEAGAFDRPTLTGGMIFKSGFDQSIQWVQPLAAGGSDARVTTLSHWDLNDGCINASETHDGFVAIPNVTDGDSGSGAPDGGVPSTYTHG